MKVMIAGFFQFILKVLGSAFTSTDIQYYKCTYILFISFIFCI